MIGFTESIAKEIADNNVKVMAICPGGVDTKMIDGIVDNGYNLSNRNYDMIFNQKDYYNG